MNVISLLALTGCLLTFPIWAQSQPTIESFAYPGNVKARKAWKPMGNTAHVSAVRELGHPALRLPCNFAGTAIERASWDLQTAIDLASASGIAFEVLCRDASPISYFSIYFQSGNGWYTEEFYPDQRKGWQTISLDKAPMKVEGQPAGWGQIRTIRISAWRGKDSDTEFFIRNLRKTGILGVDAFVAIIHADAATEQSPREGRTLEQSRRAVNDILQSAGIRAVDLSDRTLTGSQLKAAKLVVLPHNPVLSETATKELLAYSRAGGKLIGFNAVPAALEPAFKVRAAPEAEDTCVLLRGDLDSKKQMLLTMIGAWAPDVARQATQARIDAIGDVASFATYQEASREIDRLGRRNARVQAALKAAEDHRRMAVKLRSRAQYLDANKAADAAREKMVEAFCHAQTSLTNEFRAFWCHSAFGVRDMTWDTAIRLLAKNGFTAILPNMLWGGAAFCESSVLPEVAGSQGDQVRQCLAACKKYGIQMHVWKVNWNLGHASPKAFAERMRLDGRLQVSATGEAENWLCPSHPENQKLEIDSLVDLVRRYDVDGIHFDYIRYPGNSHCFCNGCRERFGKSSGVRNWPDDVLSNTPMRQKWLDWRRGHITRVVREVSEQARAIKPQIKISAAVFSNWSVDRDSVGQDWKLWCEAGYLDFVCPMDYTINNNRFESLITRQLDWAGKTPCYPGIGLSASSPRFGPDRAVEQINIARKHKTGGFVIFNYGANEAKTILPKLGLGITARDRAE